MIRKKMLAMMVVAMLAASLIFASFASAQTFGAGGGNTGFNSGSQQLFGNSNATCVGNPGICQGGDTTAVQNQQNNVVTGQGNTTCNQIGAFAGPILCAQYGNPIFVWGSPPANLTSGSPAADPTFGSSWADLLFWFGDDTGLGSDDPLDTWSWANAAHVGSSPLVPVGLVVLAVAGVGMLFRRPPRPRAS